MAALHSTEIGKDKSLKESSKSKTCATKKMSNNPLTNVYNRLQKKQSSGRVLTAMKAIY